MIRLTDIEKSYLLLEWKLIRRNFRPLFITVMLLFMTLALVYPATSFYFDIRPFHTHSVFPIFAGGLCASHGLFLVAWDGMYFNRLMTLPLSMKEYLWAKYYLFLFSGAIYTTVFGGIMATVDTKFSLLLLATYVYNAGINFPFMIYMSQFNRQKIDLSKKSIIASEQSAWNLLSTSIYILAPATVFYIGYATDGIYRGALLLVLVSLSCLIFIRPIFRWIVRSFLARKHSIISDFEK